MPSPPDLDRELARWAAEKPLGAAAAAAVAALAGACARISGLVARGPLAGRLGEATGIKSGCDDQKALDVLANEELITALKAAPVAAFASEEMPEPLVLDPGAPLLVAADPIDGSSNIDANISIGTIFSVLPAGGARADAAFLQPGSRQIAAGFAVYGPFTSLALTFGSGTALYTLDRASGRFHLTAEDVSIPASAAEYAINASNARHWHEPIRAYAEHCSEGRDGLAGRDYNMRWTASPVADIFRILVRGGVFLYPGDARPAYRHGRLRLVYEANPLGFVVEQANGAASDGETRILDIVPEALHQHIPFIAGARNEVAFIAGLHRQPPGQGERLPLFRRRGLFRL